MKTTVIRKPHKSLKSENTVYLVNNMRVQPWEYNETQFWPANYADKRI